MFSIEKFKNLALFQIFKSKYCIFTFILSVFAVSLLAPRQIFHHNDLIGFIFIISTALLITCLVRNIKEKVYSARINGASILGILSIILGFGALEACAMSAPVCGAYISTGFLALFFPNFALTFFEKYNTLVILSSFIIQFFALYQMKCFKIKSCSKTHSKS